MARPFNIRSRYGANEPTTGDYLTQGISGAIDGYLTEREARRQEENQFAAQGATPVGTPPSAGDRMRSVGSGIKRFFGRGGTDQESNDTGDLQFETEQPRLSQAAPPPATPVTPSPRASFAPPPIATSPSMRGSPAYVDQRQAPRPPIGGPDATPPIMPTRATSIGDALGQATGSPAAPPTDYSYEQTARSGQRYKIDPLRNERARMTLTNEDEQTKLARNNAEKTRTQEEEIKALTDAGMPPKEARARVLSGTVRYDTEFGQQFSPRGSSSLTFAQRQQLQTQHEAASLKVAQLSAAGRENTGEYRQAMMALSIANLRIRQAELVAGGFEKEATALESQIPKGTDAVIANSTPGGAAAVTQLRQRAGAARDSSRSTRIQGAADAGNELAPARGGSPTKTKLTQAQYDAGLKKGHTDAEIAAAYDLTGVVRRP